MMAVDNVVLLTVDALRADHLAWHGYERETSPTIDRLAEEGVVFQNAYSASSHTREALPALLTGRYPDRAVSDGFALAATSVAERLGDHGLRTGGFHSNPYASRAYGFDAGFDRFHDDLYLGNHRLLALAQRLVDKLRNNHYERATSLNDRAVDWLDASDEPSFLWAHYMDAHGPYEPPAEYQRLFREEAVAPGRAKDLYQIAVTEDDCSAAERRTLIDLYDAEIRYLDAALDSLFERLDAAGLLETSLVIITADHGDAFGEHGYYGHPRYLHDELIHVPLIVLGPGVSSTTIDVPVSTIDVVPTILDSLGVDDSPEVPGLSLFDVVDDPTAFEDRLVFSQARCTDRPSIRRFAGRGQGEGAQLERDMATGAVLSETGSDGAVAPALRNQSARRLTMDAPDGTADDPPKAIEHRLEALGYLEK